MKLSGIVLPFLMPLFCVFLAPGCKKNADINSVKTDTITDKPILTLPQRQAKVYIGIADRWHETADPNNYSQWNYVRTNADGYYTNFIAMWINSYQNPEDPQQSCNDMRKAFTKNGCFFETSLETKVNDDATGGNNEATDKKYIDFLTNAGFNVDYTSLNYGVDAGRVNTLQTYKSKRYCLALEGPWLIGGDVLSDATAGNKNIRTDILATDGVETDGPLGFWLNDSQNMREGSYSLAKFAANNKKISAIMLAPADGGITAYNPTTDFFNTSKQCVLGHEDNNASPDLWTIWTYGERSDEPTFPESIVNANGDKEPANTLMGVGYWLIKHLNDFPKLEVKDTGAVNNQATVKLTNDSSAVVTLSKGSNGGIDYTMPLIISNNADPAIEISPVIHAVLSGDKKDWDISFSIAGKDVTDDVVYNGGLNCIKNLRLSKANKIILNLNLKAKNANSAPVTVKMETMSNISNTKNRRESYTVVAKAL